MRLLLAAALCAPLACQGPVQQIPIQVDPPTASVFLDGAALQSVPPELSLASDRSHILFFRGEGYRPQQLVLETRENAGAYSLEPGEIRVRLEPLVPTERDLVIEGDDAE